MEELGRYYTKEKISQLLISQLDIERPEKILELGIGDGSLSLAAFKRWKTAKYSAVDIDTETVNKVKNELEFIHVRNGNVLDSKMNTFFTQFENDFDLAICNPPYLKYKPNLEDFELLKKAGFDNSVELKNITTDLMFLVKNLFYLKKGSELGIILPDSLLTNHTFELFRIDLLTSHKIKKIIQLPDKVFKKTEARTHILIIEKGTQTTGTVSISKAGMDGEILTEISVANNELQKRMDFDYHLWKSELKCGDRLKRKSIKDVAILLKRGNKTKKFLDELNIPYFHTNKFKDDNLFYDFDTSIADFPENVHLALPGDILIARVGKRCIGKVGYVQSGAIPISDCIYTLRVDKKNALNVLKDLTSIKASMWFQANAHGVCARVISKKDFLDFELTEIL